MLADRQSQGRVVHQKVQRLLPRPAVEVQADVDHRPGGSRHLHGVQPENRNRIFFEEVKVVAETLGVGGPAFPVNLEGRRRSGQLPERDRVSENQKLGKVGVFYKSCCQVMTGKG